MQCALSLTPPCEARLLDGLQAELAVLPGVATQVAVSTDAALALQATQSSEVTAL